MEEVFKANTQLVARCSFDQTTSKVTFDCYEHYYPTRQKKSLFN